MIVIRDFLDNVDEVLDFAETTPYHDYTYFTGVVFKGLRTPNLVELLPEIVDKINICLLYTSPSPRDRTRSRMPSSA